MSLLHLLPKHQATPQLCYLRVRGVVAHLFRRVALFLVGAVTARPI